MAGLECNSSGRSSFNGGEAVLGRKTLNGLIIHVRRCVTLTATAERINQPKTAAQYSQLTDVEMHKIKIIIFRFIDSFLKVFAVNL